MLRNLSWKLGLIMFRLDYLSCFLTILAAVLVGRKSWTGLLISIVNSLIVCVIGFRTSQFGFIPANVICICVYTFSLRSWLKKSRTRRISTDPNCGIASANDCGISATWLRSGKLLDLLKRLAPQTRCKVPVLLPIERISTIGRI
jgi:hypothetical protein